MKVLPLGDAALLLDAGNEGDPAAVARARAIATALTAAPPEGVTDVVPAFHTVGIYFDPVRIGNYAGFCAALESLARTAAGSNATDAPDPVEIPVCYGGAHGPDLEAVATHSGLTPAEIIIQHTAASYQVLAVGFLPGFAYLGGLPPALHTPRRPTPRPVVPAGAVGIGGGFTGVYPLPSPGGWNLLGRTPLPLFDPGQKRPARLCAGQAVRFRPITPEEFAAWK